MIQILLQTKVCRYEQEWINYVLEFMGEILVS